MAKFSGERLEFSLKYKGIQSATSIMLSDVQDSVFSVDWKIDTKTVFNWLFKIHNSYLSESSLNQCRTLNSEKRINQKNIKQNLSVKYDWENLTAITNLDSSWQIPSQGCYDLLYMIYKLRSIETTGLDSTQFIVDIEGQIWNVQVSILGEEELENDLGISIAEKVELTFIPFGKTANRKWKTDLLNNRISKPNAKVLIWLGPSPERLPLVMHFGTDESSVEMTLQQFSINDK